MSKYFDNEITHADMALICARALNDSQRFDAKSVREQLQKRGLLQTGFRKFVYRPFDIRWIYWEPTTKLIDEKRTEYVANVFSGNLWIAAVGQNRREYDPPKAHFEMICRHIIERGANLFPMLFRSPEASTDLFEAQLDKSRMLGENRANLSDAALAYLNTFKGVADTPHLFHHAIAIMHAPNYAKENGAALRQDWPRVPLPTERQALIASADLGRRVAALLDPETPLGKLTPALKLIANPTKTDGGQFSGSDFSVTARWGIRGKGGITMPGAGKVHERPFDDKEKAALGEAAALLGPDTCDIYLNDKAYWKNVPRRVWEYTLGGYQVLKKWLSYREEPLLGRPLTLEEVAYVQQVARRIAALILMGPELDANYQAVKAATHDWKAATGA